MSLCMCTGCPHKDVNVLKSVHCVKNRIKKHNTKQNTKTVYVLQIGTQIAATNSVFSLRHKTFNLEE